MHQIEKSGKLSLVFNLLQPQGILTYKLLCLMQSLSTNDELFYMLAPNFLKNISRCSL